MGKINSRQKGARGERMFAQLLREHGYEAERGCQHSGGVDSPDVKCNMIGCHWEIKFVEKLNLHSAIEQSKRDAGADEMPLVAHKRSREEWLVTMPFEDWMKLFKAWEREQVKYTFSTEFAEGYVKIEEGEQNNGETEGKDNA